MQRREGWVARLQELLAERPGAGAAAWSPERPNQLLLFQEGPARHGLAGMLRDPALSAHLCAWPATDDLELYAASPERPESRQLVALVREGRPWLVSGEEPPTPPLAREFAPWFEGLFLAPFPLPELAERLRPLGKDAWATVASGPVEGFPHRLVLPGLPDYALVAFAGYGCNSYACYFTEERPRAAAYLRMGFGGAYMDSASCSQGLVAEIPAVHALLDLASARFDRFEVTDNMGDISARYRVRAGEPFLEFDLGLYGPVEQCLHELQRKVEACAS